ncbi:release factor glutamine methyltransferase [Anaerobacterium chartisolvens]|uniref:Release factor glutamine methyltransferase n=1 Tax=Anaerobacterium chartisolvens TaxID=1297424 RepID=A0A369ASY7_9FIRM|nr:peptide chain release factor N(5)-glutamine methyltransferase [Anaerobacterium chartisolvens]RCX12351.1 release factor glutamine methyltransferase [Anaerobacterium chartisolvens]
MNVQDALTKGIQILKAAHIEAPAVEAGVILCDVIGCDKSFLYVHGDAIVAREDAERYFDKIELRAKGMPVQYITGRQEFMSLGFTVGPKVLIPRQDTEILVEEVTRYSKGLKAGVRILDIGTGSGCIAVSLAYYIRDAFVVAVDISCEALEIAAHNARLSGVDSSISFIHSDLFGSLCAPAGDKELFDIIVSNPPYISLHEMKGLQAEVRDYEPASALYGGADGLDFYRKIITEACGFLKADGLLAFEVGYGQAEEVEKMMKNNYYDICIIKDLSGINRVVTGKARTNC